MGDQWLQKGLQIARQCLLDSRARLAALDSAPETLTQAYDSDLTALTDGNSTPSTMAEAMAAVRNVPLVLVGDFATSNGPKELATQALTNSPGATLALTIPDASRAALVDDFLANRTSAATLFAHGQIGDRIPRFAWNPYVGLLNAAARMKRSVELVEPDANQPLATRQEAVLQRLTELAANGPVVALLGELRICDQALGSLPPMLRRGSLRLLSDSPGPYFDSIAAGHDGTGAALLAPRTWSFQTQPPLTRLLGFINWCEADEESLDGPLMTKRFQSFAQSIRQHFQLPPGKGRRTTVFPPGDPRYLQAVALSGKFNEAQMEHLATSQRNGESRFLPEVNTAYLGQPALSHIAEEAAHCVRTQSGGAGVGESTEDHFWSIAIHEMAGYLGSKVIVPQRRAPTLPQNMKRDELDQETLAHLYGYQMAEKLWHRRDARDVRNLMKTLFLQDLVEPGVAKELYFRSLDCAAGRRR
jgi:hypothetical protein